MACFRQLRLVVLTALGCVVAAAGCGSSGSSGAPGGVAGGGAATSTGGTGGIAGKPCSAGQCAPPAPYCVGGICVQCTADANCTTDFGGRYCDLTTHSCVQCVNSSDCGAGAPYCSSNHQCVQCIAPANCGGGNMTCDTTTHRCVTSCSSDQNCQAVTGRPYCDLALGFCVACLSDGNCPTDRPYCSPDHLCVQCLSDANCAGTQGAPYCLTTATGSRCVECLTNANCGNGGPCTRDHTCGG